MQKSPLWEANGFSTSQEIPRSLWYPNVRCSFHKSPPLAYILTQIDSSRVLPNQFFKTDCIYYYSNLKLYKHIFLLLFSLFWIAIKARGNLVWVCFYPRKFSLNYLWSWRAICTPKHWVTFPHLLPNSIHRHEDRDSGHVAGLEYYKN